MMKKTRKWTTPAAGNSEGTFLHGKTPSRKSFSAISRIAERVAVEEVEVEAGVVAEAAAVAVPPNRVTPFP